jgi:hypothetical protein
VAVTVGQRGPGAVPGCGSDNVGGSQGGYDMVPTVEEEWDGTVVKSGWTVRRRCGGGQGGSDVDSTASKRARETLAT